MSKSDDDPMKRAAAPVYRRIDADLRAAPERLKPILRLIRANLFLRGFNVDQVRWTLKLTTSDVTTEMRRHLGATIRRYIEDRRLECACRLLLDTRLDYRDVAKCLGYSSLKVFSDAFDRRLGVRPRLYRATGGSLSMETALAPAQRGEPEPGAPPFVAGVAAVTIEDRCARCGVDLEVEPRVRVFENQAALCDLCALEHAPRELVELLFVQSRRRKQVPRERLDRLTEPENILKGLRRQLSQTDAELLVWALLCRYPLAAGAVRDILDKREEARERLIGPERDR